MVLRAESTAMTSATWRHVVAWPGPRMLLLLLLLSVHTAADAATGPTYAQRLQLASRLTRGATADPTSSLTAPDVVNLLTLSSATVQQAVLASATTLSSPSSTGSSSDVGAGASGAEVCANDTIATIMALTQRQMWAVRMVDAAGKPKPGILDGNFVWPGAYDMCFSIRSDITGNQSSQFSGQYCTATVPIAPAPQGSFFPIVLSIGLCVPSTCSSTDMTSLLTDVFVLLNTSLTVQVTCPEKDKPLDTKAKVAIAICSVLLAMMVAGTVLDILFIQMPKWRSQEVLAYIANGSDILDERQPLLHNQPAKVFVPKPGFVSKFLIAFSIYTNGSKLLSTRQPPGSLTCIHGIRFLSMTWVVLGHSFMFPLSSAENAGRYLSAFIQRWTAQAITSATVSVDSFFALSGLLVAYLTLKEMKKRNGKLNWFMFYFHRFWRLTPAYMLVIMVYTCLSPYWGDGPLWPATLGDRDNCNSYWWRNLLYINNLVHTEQMCLGQSWYLANDMQFYILSPLILLPLFYLPLLGLGSAMVFMLVSAITPGILTMRDSLPPGIVAKIDGNFTNTMDYMDFYVKPYNRMGPYVVGMLAGYFLYRNDCRLKINKIVNLCAWAVAAACALAVLYGLYGASTGSPVTLATSAFYNAVQRHVWGACVCWVVVACVTGNGGFVNTILSWPAFVPLSRLTYCIYLLHLMMMELYLLNSDTTFYMNDINVVMFFLSILVVSYMAATVASLAFEAPMMGLEKVLLHRETPDEASKADVQSR
ncbi:nose resistant to fluoxetine protein 6-like isoform X2 [Pomacea canaliculata]|uniref:nose resistant to fluoxetine protein 6-like isoform X2 n=1 Tax=Pomacea canaliculata TaxID=400727 RepID=UPI000D7311E1|nr:nose resistant to fluoxetine protein 6-like isoform X2 [Pomacea canaliculata]